MMVQAFQSKFAAIGECMLEFSANQAQQFQLNFAGDTYNVAWYIAQYNQQQSATTSYVTALGDDPYSHRMLQQFRRDHIDTSFISTIAQALPGLYLINTDNTGEREFFYYRQQAAARQLFYTENIAARLSPLRDYQVLYFSGITLAILDDYSLQQLFLLIQQARQRGAVIAFDSNYRARLWPDAASAAAIIAKFLPEIDICLETFTDLQQLYAFAHAEQAAQFYRDQGVAEVVIKQGEQPCVLANEAGLLTVAARAVTDVVDTTGAGDSFNAAYLLSRMRHLQPVIAAENGHLLAQHVIQQRGAIIGQQWLPALNLSV